MEIQRYKLIYCYDGTGCGYATNYSCRGSGTATRREFIGDDLTNICIIKCGYGYATDVIRASGRTTTS